MRVGRFAAADAAFRATCSGRREHDCETLRAELAERVGRPREAERIAKALVADESLVGCLRTRCLTVLGSIALENGNAEEALRTLQAAVSVAKEHSCLEELCWAELRMVSALLELSHADINPALLALRRHVAQTGSPLITAALHVFVSEFEAKRGASSSARRHVRIARDLLGSHENAWLEGLSGLADTCAAYFDSDLESAYAAATSSLDAVGVSGHERTRLAAYINLAHISVARNDLSRGQRCLDRAWKIADLSPRYREALIESYAELELARQQPVKCLEYLDRLFAFPSPESSFTKLWGHQTLAKCRSLQGDWNAADAAASRGVALAETAGNRAFGRVFRLLRAEARAALGDLAAAALDLTVASLGRPDASLEVFAEAQRVVGQGLTREGDSGGAALALNRGYRVFGAIGQIRSQREVSTHISQLAGRRAERKSLTAAPVTLSPGSLVASIAAALQQAARPDLLGAELADLLVRSGVSSRVAVLVLQPSGTRSVDRVVGWTPEEARAAASGTDQPLLPLGTWRDATWQLIADVPLTVSARTTWLAMTTITAAGVELAAARRDAREREALWPIENPDDASPGVFGSEQMIELLRVTKRIATTNVTVLITGETGAGKEVIARVLHDASPRAGRPFIPLNCSAVPRDVLEDQLFGHRRGAFTGAESAFPGVIRGAAGGTVFLDEIGEVSLDLQPKLLRLLESNEVHPLGESQPIKVDVRLIAATNQDLEALVRNGRFREDLFYRLNVIRLHVPPLRERREEIPLLVSHFLERFAREQHKGRLRVADETMEYFVLYNWPGNVRQLANEVRRLVALAEPDAVLMPEHLSPVLGASRRTRPPSERDLLPTELVVRLDQPLAAATEHLERAMIQHAMTLCHGRVEQVAKTLGLSRKGLYLKRQRLKLDAVDAA